jgi:hypothetical protein
VRRVDEMIIGHGLCPYTKAVRRRASALRVTVADAHCDDSFLSELDAEVKALNAGDGETSLIVLPESTEWGKALHADFARFLSLGWKVEDFLQESSSKEAVEQVGDVGGARAPLTLQLALFHPRAVRNLWADAGPDAVEDPTEYAHRAPFPTLHLLRADDVQAVPPASAANVPVRNRETLTRLGIEGLREVYSRILSGEGAENAAVGES